MTSTDTRGLEMRVFGDIKSLHERAKARFPWLPGNVVDSKHGIFTDHVAAGDSVRDMRRGIIGIPCLSSQGEYMGMALKNFCFPAGTLVNTPYGLKPIELILPGEKVLSAIGYRRVMATSKRSTNELVKVRMKDGRNFICTPNHEVLTQKGWKKACEINENHYILGPYETMSSMRNPNQQQKSLLNQVLVSNDVHSRRGGNSMHTGTTAQGERSGEASDDDGQPHAIQSLQQQSQCGLEGVGPLSKGKGWERDRPIKSRVATDSDVSRGTMEFRHQNREVERERLSSVLQSGFGFSRHQACNRGRWIEPYQLEWEEGKGSEEGKIPCGSWVDRVEAVKQNDSRFQATAFRDGLCEVYNLQVEGHPSYCVNGLVVHNCGIKQKRRRLIGDELSFIPRDYLKTLDSLDKGDFKGVFLGNPIADNGKALDEVSEPKEGWASQAEITKTSVWANKYNGVTINLVGTDSPNFDAATLNRYDYMVDQSDVDRVSKRPGGKDSIEWWSQIMGVRKSGAVSNKVLTVAEIREYGGFEGTVWIADDAVKVYAIDAGFGGDPCVRTWLKFGREVGGQDVIEFGDQRVIPILMSSKLTAEEQIANYARADCLTLGIPFANVYFDAGMFATLAVWMSRLLSPEVNAVNFGGTATQRPVSNDTFVFDEKMQQRRLKTCYEQYSKFVTELWFSVRLSAQCRQLRKFPMAAAEEFGRRQWEYVSNDRYELETKDDYKLRWGGESPNNADSVAIAVEGARQRGFQIKAMKSDSESENEDDFFEKESKDWEDAIQSKMLTHA
jgi:hypothetical protein